MGGKVGEAGVVVLRIWRWGRARRRRGSNGVGWGLFFDRDWDGGLPALMTVYSALSPAREKERETLPAKEDGEPLWRSCW